MRWSVLAVLVLAGCATAGTASVPDVSWGKAGVSFDSYLSDAVSCANQAATVRADPEVLVQSRITGGGSAVPGSSDAAAASNDAMLAAADAQRRAQVRADTHARQAAHDQCLTGLGYSQFRLTADQRARANAMPMGSTERAHYLHSLASDPAVLSAQHP